MIWRSRRGWVLRVRDEYYVLDVLGLELEAYAPAHFLMNKQAYFVDHYAKDDQLVARTAIGERWGPLHEMTVLERGLMEDVSKATRRHLRALHMKLPVVQALLDDLDARGVDGEPLPWWRLRFPDLPLQPEPPLPPEVHPQISSSTLWRSRRGIVMRVGVRFYVLDDDLRVLEVHEPQELIVEQRTTFVVPSVEGSELVVRTSIGERWSESAVTTVVESGLREDTSELVRALEATLPFMTPIADVTYEVSPESPPKEAPVVEAPVQKLDPDVERALRLLQENRNDSLCNSMVSAMHALAEGGSAFALTAFARASLLFLRERDVPKIDETWTPIESPLAHKVALLVDRLDERDARDAADAMETCAALLGYRDGFPVLRT